MRMRLLAVVLTASAVLAACGGQADDSGAPLAGPPAGNAAEPAPRPDPGAPVELDSSPTLERIKQRGKLMVGLRNNDPKFAARAGAGSYRGFDVEVGRILAEGAGLDPAKVTFRWLPPTLADTALQAGNVDVQMGVEPSPNTATVGPYAVTQTPKAQRFAGIKPGDETMRKQLQGALDQAVADGRWQRAYDGTLGTEGVAARPTG